MEKIIFITYQLLISLISIIFVLYLNQDKDKFEIEDNNIARNLIIFMVYMSILIYLTGTGTIYDISRYAGDIKRINIDPFSEHIDLFIYVMNVIIFIPIGIMLSHFWKSNFLKVSISGFLISLIIEVFQLFNKRVTDIDDLILNTIGAILGYIIYKLAIRKDKSATIDYKVKINPVVVFLIMVIMKFLFYNEFALAKMIYKF